MVGVVHSIESLLTASREDIGQMLASTRVAPQGDQNARRTRIAQSLGLNSAQLVCGFGFNRAIEGYTTAIHFLGFSSFDALASERNYVLIHDRYSNLSVNDILEIYRVLGSEVEQHALWSDLVSSRLITIESQLEETINPILIGGYKLEVRGVYEHHLASPAFVQLRLNPNYAVLRDIANECANMLTSGSISPEAFIRSNGLTAREKARMVTEGLLDPAVVEAYLSDSPRDDDVPALTFALENRVS
tara:strand:+ start:517 stop:1254 length:738 start_codon:yes stop_codon:yes gene_type:complete